MKGNEIPGLCNALQDKRVKERSLKNTSIEEGGKGSKTRKPRPKLQRQEKR
jgi:hypothetical protein